MKCKKIHRTAALVLAAPLVLSGCAATNNISNTTIGCVGGAVVGALGTFLVTGDPKKAVMGAG
ncbi:hypothetical protein, partial [Pseudoalteromonas sp. 3-MNA-CIBAN-0064]